MVDSAVRAYAAEKHFSAATLERWLGLPDADREALLRVASGLRLNENQFRDVLDHLAAIGARRGATLAGVLADPELAAVVRRGPGRNEAVRALKAALRRLRYPQLSAAEHRLRELARSLRLPAGVRLELPENLEGDALSLVVRARSAAELRAQARAIAAALESAAVEEMFAVLEGRW